jgi:hypothetical protein
MVTAGRRANVAVIAGIATELPGALAVSNRQQ